MSRKYQLPDRRDVEEAAVLIACAAGVGLFGFVCVKALLLVASVLAAAIVMVQ
jgi:hypothetical protein